MKFYSKTWKSIHFHKSKLSDYTIEPKIVLNIFHRKYKIKINVSKLG